MTAKPLDGFYEEGYYYYMEIRGKKMTVRDYARRIMLVTAISYDAKAAAEGRPVPIEMKDNVLSRDGSGDPFTWIKALSYEDGKLEMDYYYTIMGDSHYTLNRVDHGPFDHLLIRDREILPKIEGLWVDALHPESTIRIRKNELAFGYKGSYLEKVKIHAVSQKTRPTHVELVEESLTASDLGGYQNIEVLDNILTTRIIVCDATVPLIAYVREKDLGKLELPAEVYEPMRNLMVENPMVDVPPVKRAEDTER